MRLLFGILLLAAACLSWATLATARYVRGKRRLGPAGVSEDTLLPAFVTVRGAVPLTTRKLAETNRVPRNGTARQS